LVRRRAAHEAIPAEADASCLESGLAGSAMRGVRHLALHAQEDGLLTATVVIPLGLVPMMMIGLDGIKGGRCLKP
jgi:hypothetical protein